MQDLPTDMLAVEIARPGGPEALTPARRPIPTPEQGQILIKVEAAGVNRPDVLQRAGAYPPPPGASDLPGLECAGQVVAVGPGVDRWKPGDRVCALLPGGGYAEYALTHADHALPIPAGLTAVEAAALPETFFTVWTNVFDRARLRDGETFLVHGGSSGIGSTAIQLARAFGARVFATVGSEEKAAFCRALGAELAINYKTEDFVEAVRGATGGRGVDVILDMVGGEYLARDVAALADDGRLVMIAFLGGSKATLNFAPVMVRRLTITGSTLRPQSIEAKAAIARALEAHVWPLIEAGRVGPRVHATFPLAEAARAHELMESSAHMGKIVLTV
ncbi:NAD(P)H-quinone oxidoreductase [Oceanicella actignis]|uniref:Putative NAD(P)H quinone oxidoreductase, PIG3 family n=1 Tax=Oceanicella actignis TaxID=1189325 RepID=A0A1M7TF22_9RHOB|nr:NAD(P)H-quinone oxidoreductase [Oceanicella actignis]TYO88557.1 putative PIG3 family NAD(P)H quinone oxidoreductase [Oceanicella actignis]SET61379.1 putative NAD(P)H quinone oxidoreductase, PIG3 family [Oceanicella actignis]SHN69364.1 putative NAD(P)H quinone oxidoreductase, PIG3 family [Oceanicella actignis]